MENVNEYLKKNLMISDKAAKLCETAEKMAEERFSYIEKVSMINQAKVMKAFADENISEIHFVPSTGYGYNDCGREAIEAVFAKCFNAEDALVRHTFVNGTHALSTALFAVLRPGDTMLSVTGSPYDTLRQAIGIDEKNGDGSLADFGVGYREVRLKPDGSVDYEKIADSIDDSVKVVYIQRSKGYLWRDTLSVEEINKIIDFSHGIREDICCIVDNCYGEFVQTSEPRGDLIAGSLIKNPGGGIARTGAYIAGKKKYVDLAAYRLTSVGIGKECGATLDQNRLMLQGIFMAPHTVAQALKCAALAVNAFSLLGYETCPKPESELSDIICSVKFNDEGKLISFIQGIQAGSPVDAHVVPMPWEMPGYKDKVIMAAGTFVSGSSIELSADAPIKPPYVAYIQGGLTYESAKIGILKALDKVL